MKNGFNIIGGVNIGNILNKINQGLTLANKAIPLYNQALPIIKNLNISSFLSKVSKQNENIISKSEINNENNKTIKENIKSKTNIINNNNPVFFK